MGRNIDKKNVHKFLKIESIGRNVRLAERDARQQRAKHLGPLDKVAFENGIKWFNEGLLLEDADEKYRNNDSFVNGFNHAERLKKVNDKLELSGAQWYEKGNSLEDAAPIYSDSEAFIKGYNDAKNKNQRKGL